MNESERESIRAITAGLEALSESEAGGERARLRLVAGEGDEPVSLRLVANEQGYLQLAVELLKAVSSAKGNNQHAESVYPLPQDANRLIAQDSKYMFEDFLIDERGDFMFGNNLPEPQAARIDRIESKVIDVFFYLASLLLFLVLMAILRWLFG